MNNKFCYILMMMTIIMCCARPNIIVKDYKTDPIIHYSQLKSIERLSDYVVYLNKGDKISLKMTLDSKILDIANEEINLILKQKVYFRLRMPDGINAKKISAMREENKQKLFKNIMIYISPDAKMWAPYTDIKAVAQIFGIKGGSFSFGMGIMKNGRITIFLNAKTNI